MSTGHEPQVFNHKYLLVEHIDTFGKNLTDWEVKFIAGLIDNPPKTYSEKQIGIIDRIYDEKC